MYYSTIAIFAATMAPFPTVAKTVLPSLTNKGAGDLDEDYDCQVHLNTDKDIKATPEEIAIFEQALILSANEVYGQDEMHIDKAAVKAVKHGPKPLITVEGGIHDDMGMDISNNRLRGDAQVGRKRKRYVYSTFYSAGLSADCYLCRNGGDGPFHLAATKKGGKKGGDKHALWEETLCDLLNQTPAFENAEDCLIVVTQKGKLEPVLDWAMGVTTTEFLDMEEERN
jgi:hypothetical protein